MHMEETPKEDIKKNISEMMRKIYFKGANGP